MKQRKTPIFIKDIIDAVNCHDQEAIDIMQLLLKENPDLIGFDANTNICFKKEDIEIRDYLVKAKAFIGQIEK